MNRRLPAYARAIADARRRGLVPATPTGWVFVVIGWPMHRIVAEKHLRVVVELDADPHQLDFSFLAGLHVLIAHQPQDRAVALALGDAIWPWRPLTLTAAPVPCEPPSMYHHWHPPGDIRLVR